MSEAPGPSTPEGLAESLRAVLRGLADTQLRETVTTALAPAIYVLSAIGVAVANLYLTLQAFGRGWLEGLVWLLLVLPVMTLVGVIAVRVLLESLLCLFRLVVHMELLMEQLHTLRGQTASIADRVEDLPLPRITFWRSRRREGGGA